MVQMYWNAAAGTPAADNPWFNMQPTHPYNVGYQFNHESAATKYFFKNVVKFWNQEYKIDGYRFDLAKGFTQVNSGNDVGLWGNYDASRIAIWKDYNTYMKSIDPTMYVILEYFAGNKEESELADQGMMFWNNLSGAGEQSTMGYPANPSWDLSGLFYDSFGFTAPYNRISYFESHDEERLQFKNETYGNSSGSYTTKDIPTGLKRDEMAATFMLSSPGPKMLWEFGERGYDISIDNGGRLGDKPPHWEYMQDANRHHLYQTYSRMIKMKIKNPVFTATAANFHYNLGGYVKTIQLLDASNNVELFGNFDINPEPIAITFPSAGTWYDNVTGTSITLTSATYNITLAPGEYHLYSNTPLKLN
jgi:hypothetical protein